METASDMDCFHFFVSVFFKKNAADRNRTGTMLPPWDFKSHASASSATPAFNRLLCQNGTYRARTYDPLLVRQMLSQLS